MVARQKPQRAGIIKIKRPVGLSQRNKRTINSQVAGVEEFMGREI
jgi:hypothetical protein